MGQRRPARSGPSSRASPRERDTSGAAGVGRSAVNVGGPALKAAVSASMIGDCRRPGGDPRRRPTQIFLKRAGRFRALSRARAANVPPTGGAPCARSRRARCARARSCGRCPPRAKRATQFPPRCTQLALAAHHANVLAQARAPNRSSSSGESGAAAAAAERSNRWVVRVRTRRSRAVADLAEPRTRWRARPAGRCPVKRVCWLKYLNIILLFTLYRRRASAGCGARRSRSSPRSSAHPCATRSASTRAAARRSSARSLSAREALLAGGRCGGEPRHPISAAHQRLRGAREPQACSPGRTARSTG